MSPSEQAAIFERLGIDPDDLPEDAPKADPQHVALLLRNIGGILHQSESYRALPEDEREAILRNTERIAAALSDSPEQLVLDADTSNADAAEARSRQPTGAPSDPNQDPFALSL